MGYRQGGGGFDRGPREMHKATCADCQKECEVPFKPSGDRPVYCKECFSKRKSEGR
jgi:CxxC-x17-CxxC domain-containing protein